MGGNGDELWTWPLCGDLKNKRLLIFNSTRDSLLFYFYLLCQASFYTCMSKELFYFCLLNVGHAVNQGYGRGQVKREWYKHHLVEWMLCDIIHFISSSCVNSCRRGCLLHQTLCFWLSIGFICHHNRQYLNFILEDKKVKDIILACNIH